MALWLSLPIAWFASPYTARWTYVPLTGGGYEASLATFFVALLAMPFIALAVNVIANLTISWWFQVPTPKALIRGLAVGLSLWFAAIVGLLFLPGSVVAGTVLLLTVFA